MSPRTLNSVILRIVFTLGFLLAPVGVSSVLANESKAITQLSTQDKADLDAIAVEMQRGIPYRLNMANPLHYRVVVASIKRGGDTPENSPNLFKRLDQDKDKDRLAGKKPFKAIMDFDNNKNGGLEDLNFITSFSRIPSVEEKSNATTEKGPTYRARAVSSVKGGTNFSQINLSLYRVSDGYVFGANSGREYGQGTDLNVVATGQMPDENQKARIFATFTYETPDGNRHKVAQYIENDEAAVMTCMSKPNYCAKNDGKCTGEQETSCTNYKPNTTPIKLCWNRLNQAECDYWNSQNHPSDFIFPLQGVAEFKTPVVQPAMGYFAIFLKKNGTGGGGCKIYFQEHGEFDPKFWKINHKTIDFVFPSAAFANDRACLGSGAQLTTDMYVTATVTLHGATGLPPRDGVFIFSSDRNEGGIPGVTLIPKLYHMEGCLAAGTMITLADGSERAVETFTTKAQEQVKSATGPSTVQGITTGHEQHEMIRIRTADNYTVLMTRTHPVILDNGVMVQARQLRKDDVVTTLKGKSAIVDVSQEKYTGAVYNLLTNVDSKSGTYFAGGILTGDANMQQALALVTDRDPLLSSAEIRERVPVEWHKDMGNDIRSQ